MKAFAKNSTHTSSPNPLVQRKGESPFFGVQAKLNIGKADDAYEREADHMADKVVAKTESTDTFFGNGSYFAPSPTPSIQKLPFEDVQKQDESEEIQEKPLAETITPVVQLNPEEEDIQEKCAECEAEEADVQKVPFEDIQKQEEEVEVQEKCDECEADEHQVQKTAIEFPEVPEANLEETPLPEAGEMAPEEQTAEQSAEEGGENLGPAAGVIDIPKPKKGKKEKKEKEEVQTKASGNSKGNDTNVESSLKASRGGGSPLSPEVNQQMSSGFGTDFSNVRIHTGSSAVQMSQDLGAHAFTSGNDIYFNEGKYDPESKEGKHLLAHELTHTVQQGATSSTIQRFTPTAKTVSPEPSEGKPNDGAEVEGKASNKIDNDPDVQEGQDLDDDERAEKEEVDRGEVHSEKSSVQSEGVSSPEVDRGAAAVEKTTAQKEEMNAQLDEEQPAAEEEGTQEADEAPSNMQQADMAAQEATAAEQAALSVTVPDEPEPFQHPEITAPVDSAGEPLPRQGSVDTQVRGLGYIGEMLREKGYEMKRHAAEKEMHSYGMDAVIAKQKEDLALAREGTSKIETQNEERKEISETSKKALDESKQRQEFVASEAPGLAQEAESGKSDSSALASDANSKAEQSQSEIPDDPDARADAEQQSEEMSQTSDGAQSMDDAITQTGERAQQYITDAQTAATDNQQAETTIAENDGIVAQIDGRTAEMNALNEASQASIDNVAAGPALIRQHSQRAAASGDELIAATIVMESELLSIQEEYMSGMAAIESKEDAERRVREEQEAEAPAASPEEQQLYELAALPESEQEARIQEMPEEEKQGLLATLDVMIANTPDNGTDATEGARYQVTTGWSQGLQNAQDTVVRFGLETQFGAAGGAAADAMGLGVPDPGDPRAPRIQAVDNARTARLSGVLDVADQNMGRLSQEQQQMLAERLVAESITDDIANINVLQMGRDMLVGMVNPAMALQGVVGGLEKTFTGVANIFNAEAWERDPLGNLLQIAADISTGLAMVFSSILGIAGMITALMIALTIISWGTLSPVTGPVIGWMGTVMTYAGWGAIISGLLSVYFNSLAYIKNLHDAGTAETARELFGNTEQMRQNATDGFQGAMAVVEGVGAVKMAPGMRSGQLLADLPPNPGAFARQTINGARQGLSNIASLPARAARGARRLFAGGRQGLTAFKRKIQSFFRRVDGPDATPNTPRSSRHTQEVLDGNRTRRLDEMTPEQRRIDLEETANHPPRQIDPDSPHFDTHDIEIESNGHTYRRRRDGNGWCRFSAKECGIGESELPDDVRQWLDENDDMLRQNGALDDTPENMERARQDAERDMAESDGRQQNVDETPDAEPTTGTTSPRQDRTPRQQSFEAKIDARTDLTPEQRQYLRDYNDRNPHGGRSVDNVLEQYESGKLITERGDFYDPNRSRRPDVEADVTSDTKVEHSNFDEARQQELADIQAERQRAVEDRNRAREQFGEDSQQYKDAQQRVVNESERLGETSSQAYMESEYPGSTRLESSTPGGKQGEFDFVYEHDGQIYVVESKGGSSRRGSRQTREGIRAEQGTPQYRDDIVQNMLESGDPEVIRTARRIQEAIESGNLNYIQVSQKVDHATGELVTSARVQQFSN